MPFDGIVISKLVDEFNARLVGSKIDKIYQPEKDEIILTMRSYKETIKLVLSASSNNPKVHMTTQSKDNPMVAPAFCMLLRKHLGGARILSFQQPRMDRVVEIRFECFDELGYSSNKKLIIEIMGRNSNIIFVDQDSNVIIDCIKKIDEEMSRLREVLPGIQYTYPPSFDKHNPLEVTLAIFQKGFKENQEPIEVQKFLYQLMYGISPQASTDICLQAQVTGLQLTSTLEEIQIKKLYETMQAYIKNAVLSPQIIQINNAYKDFYCYDLSIYEHTHKIHLESMNVLIDTFYARRDVMDRMKQRTSDLRKLLSNKLDRCNKKLNIQVKELDASVDAIKYKIYGDLITSFSYMVTSGAESVTLQNFYNENNDEIMIQLDPRLNAIENAQRYYKLYTKSKNAKDALTIQMIGNKQDIDYLEGQLMNLENCTSELDINEIKEELISLNYMKKSSGHKAKQTKKAVPLSFKSPTGFEIYVGKNNVQNDQLTFKVASYNDLWLHAKDIPGSHVIIKSSGASVDDATLEYAASLAAYYSKGKKSPKVSVDYTLRKNVKKPNGAKPGFVIYDNQTTVYVAPKIE